jgi:hypothetical protein
MTFFLPHLCPVDGRYQIGVQTFPDLMGRVF